MGLSQVRGRKSQLSLTVPAAHFAGCSDRGVTTGSGAQGSSGRRLRRGTPGRQMGVHPPEDQQPLGFTADPGTIGPCSEEEGWEH